MNIIRYRTPRLTRWSSVFRLPTLEDVLDTVATQSNSSRRSAPSLDLYENDESYTVRLEVVGAKKEDFDVFLEADRLTVANPSFRRSVTLVSPIRTEGIQATYENGILSIALPKAEESKPKKINVSLN